MWHVTRIPESIVGVSCAGCASTGRLRTKAYPDADFGPSSCSNPSSYPHPHCCSHTRTNFYADSHPFAHSRSHFHANPYLYTNSNTYGYTNSNTYGGANSNTYGGANSNTYGGAYPDAASYAHRTEYPAGQAKLGPRSGQWEAVDG